MSRVNYKTLVGEDTFLAHYMRHMGEQETPSAYDFWGGVWALSSTLMRHVVIDRPRAPVFLNWYVILVAESGVTRKSTAVRESRELLRSVGDEQHVLLENKSTPEALVLHLHQNTARYGHATASIAVSEMVTFLGRERYNMAMPGLLTDLYDCPRIRDGGGSVSRGAIQLRNVVVSFLSASTPSWLARAINPDVITGGFTSRCVFVVAEDRKRSIAWPDTEDTATQYRESLARELREIAQLGAAAGRIHPTPAAVERFRRWYERRELHGDLFRSSYESREDAHVLRLAACLAANDRTFVIEPRHVEKAVRVIREVKNDAATIFDSAVEPDKMAAGISKLKSHLIAAKQDGIAQSQLYAKCRQYMSRDDFTTALDIMHELGLVQRFELPPNGPGRPPTIWRATKKIADRKLMQAALDALK